MRLQAAKQRAETAAAAAARQSGGAPVGPAPKPSAEPAKPSPKPGATSELRTCRFTRADTSCSVAARKIHDLQSGQRQSQDEAGTDLKTRSCPLAGGTGIPRAVLCPAGEPQCGSTKILEPSVAGMTPVAVPCLASASRVAMWFGETPGLSVFPAGAQARRGRRCITLCGGNLSGQRPEPLRSHPNSRRNDRRQMQAVQHVPMIGMPLQGQTLRPVPATRAQNARQIMLQARAQTQCRATQQHSRASTAAHSHTAANHLGLRLTAAAVAQG